MIPQVAHIPGALFFNIDGIVDQTTDVRNLSGYFDVSLVEVNKQQVFSGAFDD